MTTDLPSVAPAVTAELVAALSPRLRKRLDAGVAKLRARPAVREGDAVRIALDDDTDIVLEAPGGTVTSATAIRCGCLLAPDCLHRAAVASAAPIADDTAADDADDPYDADAPDGRTAREDEGTRPEQSRTEAAFDRQPTDRQPAAADRPAPSPPAPPGEADDHDAPTTGHMDAARAVFDATAAVLVAGTDGAGAVLQAELLRAAHSARLAGLPRASAAAVSVVNGVRAARTGDAGYRLADLTGALADVLGVTHRLPRATGAELAGLRGSARRPYRPDGSLRLYGLFSEPVLTATGYAGAVTWTVDTDGRLYSVADVAPGGAARAASAAGRTVRMGDTALTHGELSRAGLAVSGATVSPTGRLGAGGTVRAVRAPGAAWREEPSAGLWAEPVAEQVRRALNGTHDLLFLDVTLIGAVREAAGDCLLADCGGVPVRLTTAHDDPALPFRDNLRLLAAVPGTRLRVVARLMPAPLPRAALLAAEHPGDAAARVNLGLDRLQRADLPRPAPGPVPHPAAPAGVFEEAPLHLLRRRVQQAVSGGRRVLSLARGDRGDGARLRAAGLATAADLLDALHAAAAVRARDAFGRLLPADTDRFARAWLAAAVYTDTVESALCAHAWEKAAVPV
ncbi:hypothetical protein ACFQE4_30780 [Streptomyces thermocoprophilus]|uniref:SWIM-type domain-containing protein n=1 Tax=Streptomyces thermocoprophilus TaxID=78356 RepID=A0ABV5V6Y5_9ACTN